MESAEKILKEEDEVQEYKEGSEQLLTMVGNYNIANRCRKERSKDKISRMAVFLKFLEGDN